MFLIRQTHPADVSTLVKMAKMVYFINLPPSEQFILDKIEHSHRCFAALAPDSSGRARRRGARRPEAPMEVTGHAAMERDSEFFMFSLEDVATGGGVIGTSQIRARQGGPGNPNWSFRISEKRYYSPALKYGTSHAVGQLYGDESGPSELGGLILQPSYRGHSERPGRFLSFVRFHFIGLFRQVFADRILAEMMGPLGPDGENPFWDAFGRKFIPVKFAEADRFCQHDRSFIPDLLPKEAIYLSLLPLEVQNSLGVVARDTIPARKLLESLGFRHRGFIDPFDGGPHLDAATDKIPLVTLTRRVRLGRAASTGRCTVPAIVSSLSAEQGFRAVQAMAAWDGERDTVRLDATAMSMLGVSSGETIGFTPMTRWSTKERVAAGDSSRATPRARARKVAARTPRREG
ncbi:MAG: arginine N-succinyltransferase [Phycisphaerae bacterium]